VARLNEITRYLRESLWFIPGMLAIASLLLAGVLVIVDAHLGDTGQDLPFIYAGSVEGAREVLSTIAMSMLTFTGLVFSITMLVLQAASSQLSPRVLRTFLRDRGNQVVLGLFVATFLFALVVLRYTRSAGEDGEGELVPGLSIAAAFVLLLASIGAFIYYIDHMAHAIRASTVIHNIAAETRIVLKDLFPEPFGEPDEDHDHSEVAGPSDADTQRLAALPSGAPTETVKAPESGVLVNVDEKSLLKSVGREDGHESEDRFVEMVSHIGDYLPEGSTVFRVWGSWDEDELKGLQGAVQMSHERTIEKDAAFGIRQLVDIALRALSPGINDPTTAIQAIDRLHDVLYRIVQRRIPSPVRRDPSGKAVLFLRRPGWPDYVLLSVEEIRLAAEEQVHVLRRMRQMLISLLEIAPAERRPPLEEAIERIDRSASRGLDDGLDRRIARPTEPAGQGPMTT
jgi:uncharacterized membrane protein